jgi:hypothetical protein
MATWTKISMRRVALAALVWEGMLVAGLPAVGWCSCSESIAWETARQGHAIATGGRMSIEPSTATQITVGTTSTPFL